MAKAPWYMSTGGGPSLSHHKGPDYNANPDKLQGRYEKRVSAPVTKFRKGACPNCGAMHREQDCLERPRKHKAKYTGKNFANDEETVARRKDDWDSKRDRWDGYDNTAYKQVIDEHQALEEARRRIREEEIDNATDMKQVEKVAKAGKGGKKKGKQDEDDFGSSDESDDGDEARYAEGADAVGQKVDTKTRITVRNLRIREDTAKYLLNLDTESAYYDPKTRSMRENPNPELNPEDLAFGGENFTRSSGDTKDLQRMQLFAWQSEQRGNDVHTNSNPTQTALIYKEFLEKKEALKDTSKTSILDKYGGEEHLTRVPQELLSGQTEDYVEYSRAGKLIKGQERAKARSKYDEDVYPGNHKSIWGSWFNLSTLQWGYACCHSYIKQAYCAGQAGIDAEKEAAANAGKYIPPPTTSTKSLADRHAEKSVEEREREKKEYDDKVKSKRKADGEVTDEVMEDYRKKRAREEDPLLSLGADELLPL